MAVKCDPVEICACRQSRGIEQFLVSAGYEVFIDQNGELPPPDVVQLDRNSGGTGHCK